MVPAADARDKCGEHDWQEFAPRDSPTLLRARKQLGEMNVFITAMKALNLGWQLEQHPLHTDLNGNYSTHPSGESAAPHLRYAAWFLKQEEVNAGEKSKNITRCQSESLVKVRRDTVSFRKTGTCGPQQRTNFHS